MPYIASEYHNANPRILIIGKATNGWGDKDINDPKDIKDIVDQEFHKLPEFTDSFINNRIIPYFGGTKDRKEGYYSLFWQRIYILTLALLDNEKVPEYCNDSEQSQKCFNSIAWTNVFKISASEGNPSNKLIDRKNNT